MTIKKTTLNDKYKRFCTNKKIDALNEESTKLFFEWFMSKHQLTHVKEENDVFIFLKLKKYSN